jgi:NDP-sugar pyrophosphorylase family protein
MKAILICPQANGIPVLADARPLVTLPFLGQSFISYWMQHFAAEKCREVRVITTDPTASLEACLGHGIRWGLKVDIFHAVRELTPSEARKRYRPPDEKDWVAEPGDVLVADHFPNVPGHKLFESYQDWFRAFGLWAPQIAASQRVGLREIAPGVWAGMRVSIAASAQLIAPCWIGDNVRIGENVTVGPMAFLEEQVVIERTSAILNSWVGPDTFIGALAEVKDSLAWGSLLINWKTGSHTIIPDPFLMTSLANRSAEGNGGRKSRSAIMRPLARPFEAVISLAQKLQS